MTARTLAAAALVALVGTVLAQPTKQPAEPKAAAQPKAELKVGNAPDLPKLLATRVSVEKEFDGVFKDAVKLLAEKYDLPLVVHPRVGDFDGAGGMAMCDTFADDRPVKLPRLRNVRLDTLLKTVTDQVNAKFLVYPDHIKIVPDLFAAYETGLLPATQNPDAPEDAPLLTQVDILRNRPLTKRALVNGTFKNKPLVEIVDEITEATGANVAVSPLVAANVRQMAVTVRFANAPVDSAVRTLCEMTDCAVLEDANVLLITTRERAATRAKEEAQKAKERFLQQQGIVVGGGEFGLAGPVPALDLTVEVAKLKEQNEQLKKELEEMKKLLKK